MVNLGLRCFREIMQYSDIVEYKDKNINENIMKFIKKLIQEEFNCNKENEFFKKYSNLDFNQLKKLMIQKFNSSRISYT